MIRDVFERGREHEAVQASQTSLRNISAPVATTVNVVTRSSCYKCGLHHPPKSCPAYKEWCLTCGCMGHWEKLCRKSRHIPESRVDEDRRKQPTSKMAAKSRGRKGRFEKNTETEPAGNMRSQNEVRFDPDIDTDSESENYNTYAKTFNPVQTSDVSVNAVHREEAFATVVIYHDESKVKEPLRIKIDTGSGGNTLPLRTFKQMFGSIPPEQILQREPNIKRSSYTGDNIKCFGTIELNIRRNDQNEYHCQKLCVVEVTGLAILGLPSCELLKFVSQTWKEHQQY